jgi:hypothetical protein
MRWERFILTVPGENAPLLCLIAWSMRFERSARRDHAPERAEWDASMTEEDGSGG